jgi:1-deoxy-D-xylulose-5-phosphate reductoisomerase
VDSEHNAIFQCLEGRVQGSGFRVQDSSSEPRTLNPEPGDSVRRLILTASGGPFRQTPASEFATITPEQALRHPTWNMGPKITIDSATLFNKGLEMIEARWLFDLTPAQIDVVVHPQSIVHSLVQFEDGSLKAQLGLPDMKLPIQYALAFPERLPSRFERFGFDRFPQWTFAAPDTELFRCLGLARRAMETGGNAPCVLNAANEAAVEAFLAGRIGFQDIPEIITTCLQQEAFVAKPALADYLACHARTLERAAALIPQKKMNTFANPAPPAGS